MIANTILFILAYLLGSISSAVVVCKIFQLPDPRSQGSNNPGATNVLRIGGKFPAILTLVGDSLKGAIPALIATMLYKGDFIICAVVFAALLGHIYPIFFNFKGGKGVATVIGGFFAISWILGLLFVIAWLLTFFISRISSLSALVATALSPLLALIILGFKPAICIIAISIVIFYRHKENITRLMEKNEKKLSL